MSKEQFGDTPPRIIDVFDRKVDTKTVLGHLVLIGLFPKSIKFAGSRGPWPTANPNSWEESHLEVTFLGLVEQTHQESEDPDDQRDRLAGQLAQPGDIHCLTIIE